MLNIRADNQCILAPKGTGEHSSRVNLRHDYEALVHMKRHRTGCYSHLFRWTYCMKPSGSDEGRT